MGTSSSGGGAGNNNPLIPSWIPGDARDSAPESPDDKSDNEKGDDKDEDKNPSPDKPQEKEPQKNQPQLKPIPNRFTPPRRDFNTFVRSRGTDRNSLKKSLKGYSRNAAGGSSGLARRMAPSSSRVAGFVNTLNTIRQQGLDGALRQFNLSGYVNRPLLDTISALCDEIFKDTGKAYENTQDDNITKEAYANTVVRICDLDGIDLNTLTNENVEVMVAIFIEETIAQRVISDIGNKMTEIESDVAKLVEMENTVYQVVNGLVRNEIMPEIIATQRGDMQNLERNIENIYRIAFDVLSNLTD